ncbi:hypothetical protein CASFOL_037123 [Castilleja foliolosa]|uniref:Phytosulfokine n=1 Tax=Castilleja foliolosa TaxID=1961234 RepID=A0ABD3BQC8_9LAMI
MSKATAFFVVALLLFFTLCSAARLGPTVRDKVKVDKAQLINESCQGVGEDECLMRRTLTAHIDYIYTQKQKP